jgi:hypothetical protein
MIAMIPCLTEGIASYLLRGKSEEVGISRIPAHIRSQFFKKIARGFAHGNCLFTRQHQPIHQCDKRATLTRVIFAPVLLFQRDRLFYTRL